MIVTATVLETPAGPFTVRMHGSGSGQRCLSLARGDLEEGVPAVRLHSSCLFGEAFGACDCDCRPQLDSALKEIDRRGSGVVVYMFQEGRGAGLERKITAMDLQRTGAVNSYEAYGILGLPRDLRTYEIACTTLRDLGVGPEIVLLSNNPAKRSALEDHGFVVRAAVMLTYQVDKRAYDYLRMKREEGRHTLDLDKIDFVG